MSRDFTILHGDCLALLKTLPDACVDSCVVDPPYGLSEPPDISIVLRAWLGGDGYEHQGRGFMQKSWDSFVPGPEYWREVLRVLKPGSYILCFAGTRTQDLMGIALRLAGFEPRDCLSWHYGTGFPKSLDVSKALDDASGASREQGALKRGGDRLLRLPNGERDGEGRWGNETKRNAFTTLPATAAAAEWEGFGTALKPATEPIILARKPLDGTYANNILAHGVGGLNIDGCRIGTAGGSDTPSGMARLNANQAAVGYRNLTACAEGVPPVPAPAGRWPANVIFSHNHDCTAIGMAEGHHNILDEIESVLRGDDQESAYVWQCTPGCPVAELDRQSGQTQSGVQTKPLARGGIWTTKAGNAPAAAQFGDAGGASRFFATFQQEPDCGFRYVAKPAVAEREIGCQHLPRKAAAELTDSQEGQARLDSPRTGSGRTSKGRGNVHPTVKSISLMAYLCRMITPPNGIIIDPFTGSGTTGMAAMLEGFDFIGIEREDEYVAIANARIQAAKDGAIAWDPKKPGKLKIKQPPQPQVQDDDAA